MTTPDDIGERQQQAMARRLARLGTLPVDTTRLDQALRAQLPGQPAAPRYWLRRALTIAASLMLLAALLIGLLQERAVQASPDFLAQVHQELVTGKMISIHAASVEAANAAIAAENHHFPTLPQMPGCCRMDCCCMKKIKNKNLSCMLLFDQGTPITLAIAQSADVCAPGGPTVEHNGAVYHVQHVGTLNLITTARQGRWISMIGQEPTDRLITLTEQLQF